MGKFLHFCYFLIINLLSNAVMEEEQEENLHFIAPEAKILIADGKTVL